MFKMVSKYSSAPAAIFSISTLQGILPATTSAGLLQILFMSSHSTKYSFFPVPTSNASPANVKTSAIELVAPPAAIVPSNEPEHKIVGGPVAFISSCSSVLVMVNGIAEVIGAPFNNILPEANDDVAANALNANTARSAIPTILIFLIILVYLSLSSKA